MFRIYLIGISILIIAIIANLIASKIGLATWYDFGPEFFMRGLIVVQEIGFISTFWLFILYPIILAFGYLIGNGIYNLF